MIDLTGRRSMVDHGDSAHLQIGTQEWSGLSGRALDTLPATPPRPASPLWLIDLLGGITTAEDRGVEDVDGQQCRWIAATASLIEASARIPDGLASPARDRVDDLLSLPIEVWLDADDLRQIRFVDGDHLQSVTSTVTFNGFGADLDQLDWSRLPTFCTPQP